MAQEQKAWDKYTTVYLMLIEGISAIMTGRAALFLSAGSPHNSEIAWGAGVGVWFSLLAITLIGWRIAVAINSLQLPTSTERLSGEPYGQQPPGSA